MNPSNPNFRTNDEWFDICEKLRSENAALVAENSDFREALTKIENYFCACSDIGEIVPQVVAHNVLSKHSQKESP